MTRPRVRLVACTGILLIVATLAAACGTDRSSEAGKDTQSGASPAAAPEADLQDGLAPDGSGIEPLFAPYDPKQLGLMTGQMEHDFRSLADLKSAAEATVLGRVVGMEYAPYQNIPFTIVTVEVEKPIFGNVKEGDELTIVETGGVFAGRSKVEPGETGEPVEAAFEGVPVMKEGERWLLFLTGYDPGPVATGAYSVLGVFQGKLRVSGDDRIMFAGDPARFDEIIFTVPREAAGRPVSDVIAELETSR